MATSLQAESGKTSYCRQHATGQGLRLNMHVGIAITLHHAEPHSMAVPSGLADVCNALGSTGRTADGWSLLSTA